MAGWIYTERLSDLLTRAPNAHMLMCHILSNQQDGALIVSTRELEYIFRATGLRSGTWHLAMAQLLDERFIDVARTPAGQLVTILRPRDFGIMPITEKDIVEPRGPMEGPWPEAVLFADIRTVLNFYRRVVRRGDNKHESEAVIRWWLERGHTKERLAATAEAYELECQARGLTYRKFAHNFYDPENGLVEEHMPDEAEGAAPKSELRESTKQMREAFRRKKESNGENTEIRDE